MSTTPNSTLPEIGPLLASPSTLLETSSLIATTTSEPLLKTNSTQQPVHVSNETVFNSVDSSIFNEKELVKGNQIQVMESSYDRKNKRKDFHLTGQWFSPEPTDITSGPESYFRSGYFRILNWKSYKMWAYSNWVELFEQSQSAFILQ